MTASINTSNARSLWKHLGYWPFEYAKLNDKLVASNYDLSQQISEPRLGNSSGILAYARNAQVVCLEFHISNRRGDSELEFCISMPVEEASVSKKVDYLSSN